MNKLKNVFSRASSIQQQQQQQKKKINQDNRRPQQFVKRHSLASSMISPIPTTGGITTTTRGATTTITNELPPAINLEDLSEMERSVYTSWWKDLDPFDLGKINNSTILKFLNGCSLPDTKLEQILALFETAGDGLNRLQFFAMLRLIAHAQNGRKISRALVYLGAPIPHFHTNAIDALIKSPILATTSSTTTTTASSSASNNSILNPPSAPPLPIPPISEDVSTAPKKEDVMSSNRKSWWGNEKQQESQDVAVITTTTTTATAAANNNRHSYIGPFTVHTPIPNSPYHNNNVMDHFYPLSPTHTNQHYQQPSWQTATLIHTPSINTTRPMLTTSLTTTTTIIPVTPNIIQLQVEKTSQHGRSRSAGTASDFFPTASSSSSSMSNPYNGNITYEVEQPLQSSRSSLSLHEMNTGKTLLLTQKFVYQSPSVRNQELNTTNPFTPTPKEEITSPFDDDDGIIDDTITKEEEEEEVVNYIAAVAGRNNNNKNKYGISPPPVPDQRLKPAFPKYTRTNSFLMKRSASVSTSRNIPTIAEDRSNHLQRHKSTTGTTAMFY